MMGISIMAKMVKKVNIKKNGVDENENVIINEGAVDKNKFGYARVSSIEQNEARQIEALKAEGVYKIFVEKASAKDANRPVLKQLLNHIRDNDDTICITDFSRLARSTKDLLNITDELKERNVKLVSLKENIDTNTDKGKLMLALLGAINEFERANILERQREGIAIAKREGKYKGRKEVKRPKSWKEVYNLYKTRQITGTEAMDRLGLKRNTFYRFVNEEKNADNTDKN
jgi:DNA invertase Pin-like site-specific DNA recombinase